jgi:nicotinate-nucleotide adenylyltransferase
VNGPGDSPGAVTALFGGTFDPIHIGHLIIAEFVREAAGLERVVFVPAGRPPHKVGQTHAAAADRRRMVELAVAGNEHFAVSAMELDGDRPSFTIDTVRRLKAAGAARVALILGADSLIELGTWREPEALVRECELLVVERPGVDLAQAPAAFSARAQIVPAPRMEIASRTIRARVAAGASIRYWVPEPVRAYIAEQRLYWRKTANDA